MMGIERPVPRDRSRQSRALRKNTPGLVSARLGHSSVRVTADIYSHALRGRYREAARRWDEFVRIHGGSHDAPNKIV